MPIEITESDVQAARIQIDQARDRVLNGESFGLVAAEAAARKEQQGCGEEVGHGEA